MVTSINCLHVATSQEYFIKHTRTRIQSFTKSGPQAFRKSGLYTKIHCMKQRLDFDKFEDADFKYDNSFLRF